LHYARHAFPGLKSIKTLAPYFKIWPPTSNALATELRTTETENPLKAKNSQPQLRIS